MDTGSRRALVTVLVAALAAVALLGGVNASRAAPAGACDAVLHCLDAGASEAGASRAPCLHDPACGGGAALIAGLLLAGAAVTAFGVAPPRPPVLNPTPPPRFVPARGWGATLERPPR